MNKDIGQSSDWHFISVPNQSTTTSLFAGYYLDEWDEATASWVPIIETGIPMSVLKGYSVFDVPAKASFSFSGTPITGPRTVTLSYHDNAGSNDGMNFLGNPYPSSIDWDRFNETYGAVYIWDGSINNYTVWNGAGTGSRYIPPMQGFIIHTPSPSTFIIDNDDRTHTGASKSFKGNNEIQSTLVLSTNNQDKLFVRYEQEEAHDHFDLQFDALKIIVSGDGQSQLYSKFDSTNFSIDTRSNLDTIQLGYFNKVDGIYTIEISDIDNIPYVRLEDTKLGVFHDLMDGPYEFPWSSTDSESRFKLHFVATSIQEHDQLYARIYALNGLMRIDFEEGSDFDNLELFDITGRRILSQSIGNHQSININVQQFSGAYIVRLSGDQKTESHKIILNN